MEASKKALRLASSLCLLALAGCSGGGGGGGAALNTGTNNTPSNTGGNTSGNTGTSGNTTPTPTVSIGAPDNANVTIQGAPAFNFTTNLPAVGTVFGLLGPAVQVTSTTVSAANKGTNGTITYRGMTNGVPIFDVSVPAIGLTASNVRADGTTSTLGDGSKVVLTITTLNYTAAGAWAYTPASGGTGYIGATTTGSGTPIANVPIAGSASYTGSGTKGGVAGAYFVPNGTGGISLGSLSGDIAISVNFTSGSVTGTLSNMTATPAAGGTATPWNSVSLSANVNRLANNASFTGTTGTSGAPAGAGTAGFSSAATGQLGGAFFGPNADEAGGTWTLTDPTAAGGGKTAFGGFGATSNGCSGCSNSGSTTPPPSSGVSIAAPGTGFSTFSGTSLGTNFTTNPPPIGNSIPLGGAAAAITSTSVGNFAVGQVTGTYRGTVTSGGVTVPVFDLSIPSLALTATNVRGDATTVTLADGGKVSAGFATLNYTLLGVWSYIPASGSTTYLGQAVTGYGTAPGSVPTSGSATYTGVGLVNGAYAVPSGTNAIQLGTVNGDASLNVNFAGNTMTGNFTNMQAKAAGATTTTPWNDVALAGTLTRGTSDVTFSGQTTTTANTGTAGLSAAARGTFSGALYGPTAQEIGGGWTLSETGGGGKTAFGTFGAKQ